MFSKKNPFIHGTDSGVFSIMEHTDFTMMEPIEMVDKYGIAPITGELGSRGAFYGIRMTSNPRFGRCKGYGFSLNDIIKNYACNISSVTGRTEDYNNLCRSLHNNRGGINLCIIHATRCKQKGIDISKLLNSKTIKLFRRHYDFLHFGFFINNFIYPKAEIVGDEDHADAASEIFTPRFLMNKFKHLKLRKIYRKYKNCPENIPEDIKKSIIDALTLPEKVKISDYMDDSSKVITITVRQPFTFSEEVPVPFDPTNFFSFEQPETIADYNTSTYNSWTPDRLLYRSIENKYFSQYFMQKFRNELSEILKIFRRKINILEKVLNTNTYPSISIPEKRFPIIFVSNNKKLFSQIGGEFEAIKPLKLGHEIKTVATDLPENKQYLEEYFFKHGLKCKVILFDELRKYS